MTPFSDFHKEDHGDQNRLSELKMLLKVDDGFYLNTQHIIAVHVSKDSSRGVFEVQLEYTPNSVQKSGEYTKVFSSQLEAEMFLNQLNQKIH